MVALKEPIVLQVMEKGKPYPEKVRISVNGPGGKGGVKRTRIMRNLMRME